MRFRLRTLLLLLTAVGVWLGLTVEQARRQRQAVTAILSAGGTIKYVHDEHFDLPQSAPPGPRWLRRLIGDEFFFHVDGVIFRESRAKPSDLVHLKTFRKLRLLSLAGIKVSDDDVRNVVAHHPALIWLDLGDTGVSDKALAYLAPLKLTWLGLSGNELSDASLVHLRAFPGISVLVLGRNKLRGDGLAHLAAMRKLKTLNLSENPLQAEALRQVSKLGGLEVLYLTKTNVPESALVHLKDMELAILGLQHNRLTDRGLKELGDMRGIGFLYLEHADLMPGGLGHLCRLPWLDEIRLNGTVVGDDDLLRLSGCPKLRTVFAKQTKVTSAGAAKLKSVAPLVTIIY